MTASAGNANAVVTWKTPSSNGGSPITNYTVTAADSTNSAHGGQTCAWTTGALTCTVTGLTNGDSYTFTVTATNAEGTGPASAASNSVIPGPSELAIMTTSLPASVRGRAYSIQLAAAGGRSPYAWKRIGSLPKGIKLNKLGLLSGSPSRKLAPGSYRVSVEVKDSTKKHHQVATSTFVLTIS